jgi:hypothetical protein
VQGTGDKAAHEGMPIAIAIPMYGTRIHKSVSKPPVCIDVAASAMESLSRIRPARLPSGKPWLGGCTAVRIGGRLGGTPVGGPGGGAAGGGPGAACTGVGGRTPAACCNDVQAMLKLRQLG